MKNIFVVGLIVAGGCAANRLNFIAKTPKPADFPDASAVWLDDEQIVEYQVDGDTGKPRVVVDRSLAIKLLTRKGVTEERYAPYNIQYDRTDSSVEGIVGRTILPDGEVVELDPSKDITDRAVLPREHLYASSRVKTVAFPKACPGSVIELKYRKIYRDHTYYSRVHWSFTNRAPVLRSRLTLRRAKGLTYHVVYHRDGRRTQPPTTTRRRDGDLEMVTWERRRVPALPDEPFPPPSRLRGDWLQIVVERYVERDRSFAFFRSWDDVGRYYHGLVAGQAKVTPEIRRLAKQLTEGATSEEERARRLYHYVQRRNRYVAIPYGKGRRQPTAAAETLRRGYGDCKDKANLLSALLAAVDVDSRLTLIGTRDVLPPVLDSPGPEFNHAILAVLYSDGRRLLLDPTERTIPFGQLPARDQDTQALVVHPDRGEVIDTPRSQPARNESLETTDLTVDRSGRFRGTLEVSGHGHRLSWLRHRLLVTPTGKHLEQFRGMVDRNQRALKLSNLQVKGLKDIDAPLRAKADVTMELADQGGELLVLRLERLIGRVVPRFVAPRRQMAVDLGYRETRRYRTALSLPAGTSVAHVPENARLQGPYGSFAVNYKLGKEQLIIEASLRQDVVDIPAAQYKALRAFCDKVRRVLNQGMTIKLGAEG